MKSAKYLLSIISYCLAVTLLSTVWCFENATAFDTVATFLSITIGFTITSLSIIATSPFSKELYNVEDENDNSKTLLHVLIGSFKTSTYVFVLAIGLILVYKFYPAPKVVEPIFHIKSYPISFWTILKANIWYFTAISTLQFVRLFGLFAKFVIKSATKQ